MRVNKIDVHIHTTIWRETAVKRFNGETFASPEQIREKYKALGIEKGILLPTLNDECAFVMQSNEEAHNITLDYPDLFYWFCNISPRMGNNSPTTDLSYFINHYKALGAKGVGELCCSMRFDDPLMQNLFRHCEECDMPIIIHIAPEQYGYYGIIDEPGLPGLENTLKKYPSLKILGHSQPFWAEISAGLNPAERNGYPRGKVTEGRLVELMREYENLYGDMSAGSGFNAISRDPIYGCRFIKEFQDKLMFGTDICAPSNDMRLSYWLDDAVDAGFITETAYRKVCRDNALRVLKLEENSQ